MKETYLQSVRSLLDCPAADRARLLSQLEGAVSAYLADEPEAGEAELTAAFGTPEDCAARLLENCDSAGAVVNRRKKRRMAVVLIAVLAALAVAASCYALYMRATGGTAVIEHYHYVEGIPEDFPKDGEFKLEYDFDD